MVRNMDDREDSGVKLIDIGLDDLVTRSGFW